MARPTGTQAAAKRRRIKHEQRINEQPNPLDRLALTWAWLRAEAQRHPHLLDQTIQDLHQIGAGLNDLEANTGKETLT